MTDNEINIIDGFSDIPSDRREVILAALMAIDRVIGRREKKAREELGSALWVDPAAAFVQQARQCGTPMIITDGEEYVAKPLAPEIDPKETAAAIAQGNVMASPASVWIIGDKKFTIENTADTLAPDFKFQTMAELAELAEIEKARAAAIAQKIASPAASPSAAWARAHENAAMRPSPVADADDLAF